MAESISIPCSHIQDLIDEMAPSEVSLKDLKHMLLQIQRGEDCKSLDELTLIPGESTYLNDIRYLAYQIDDQLDTIYINIKFLERWTKSGIRNVLKTLAIAYYKSKALRNIRSLIDIVKRSTFHRSQTSDPRELNKLGRLTPNFYHGHDYFSNYIKEEICSLVSCDSRKYFHNLIRVNDRFVEINNLFSNVNVKRIYHDVRFQSYFQAFAWILIAKHSRNVTVYRDILNQLISNDKRNSIIGLLYMEEEKLCLEVWEVLTRSKCLIAFNEESLNLFEECFDPFKLPLGKRSFVTTDLGERLTAEDGWKLLQSITFPDSEKEHQIHPEIKEIGMTLVEVCRCVPEQVARIGVILRENYSADDWEIVRRHFDKPLDSNSHWKIVALSYYYLPTDLKACFLYFGQFWKGEAISAEMLYQMWMAEGIVLPCLQDKRETIMDIAEDNLAILASRSLIDVKESEYSTSRKFVSCRIDDLVKQFCLRPNGLLDRDLPIIKETPYGFESSSQDQCRLSLKFDFLAHQLQENGDINSELTSTLRSASKRLRSLLIQKENGVPTIQISFPSEICKNFKLLRVLKIKNFEIHGRSLPKDIRNLLHLRFLSLEGSTLEELPKDLGNFRFMQTLDLRVAEIIPRGIIVPNVLWKLKELRHLYLPTCHQLPEGKEKLLLSGLNKLETLVNFDIQKVEITSLEWKSLRNIDVTVHGKKSLCDAISFINKSGDKLKETFLRVSFLGSSYEESEVPLEDVFNCSKINHFMVTWGRWDLITKFKNLNPFSSNVIQLCLTRCQLREDPMPILGKFVVLKKLILGKKTFMGTCMIFEERSFPSLTYLKIQSLIHLERLEICQNSLPNLFCLEIFYCIRLKMIPVELRFIESLSELKLSMPKEFNDKIRRGSKNEGEDLYKIRHVPFVFLEDV